jgi:hypothetical protein
MVYGFVGLSVLLLFILFMVLHARRKNMNKEEDIREFAEQNGFQYKHEKRMMYVKPFLNGSQNNVDFVISEEVNGTGRSKVVTTYLQFNTSPFDFQFTIGKEHFMSKLGKVFGLRDIEFQNRPFDKDYLLKAEDESKFRAMMDHELQQQLMQVSEHFNGVITNNAGILRYAFKGEMHHEGNFHHLKMMIALQCPFPNGGRPRFARAGKAQLGMAALHHPPEERSSVGKHLLLVG